MGTVVRTPPRPQGSGSDGGDDDDDDDEGECTTNTKESPPQNPLNLNALIAGLSSDSAPTDDDETSMTDEDPPHVRPASPPPSANGTAGDAPAGGRARSKSPFEARAEEAARQRRHRPRRREPVGGAEEVRNGDDRPPPAEPSSPRPRRRRSTTYQRHIKLSKSTSTPVLRRLVSLGSVDGQFAQSEGHDAVGLLGERESGAVLGRRRSDIWQPLPPSNRRSLSPESRRALGVDPTRPRQVPTRLTDDDILVEQFAASCFAGDGGVDGGGVAERRGSDPSSGEYRRRASMPKRLRQSVRNSSVLARHKDEAMDPNAMRYLPKILRDMYAQRQNRRGSDVSPIYSGRCACNFLSFLTQRRENPVCDILFGYIKIWQIGEARLASIDLRLRLQRPDHLPYYQDIRGSILILDLSGFTALGERLRAELGPREGADEFATRVNNTLSTMVRIVYMHWGDVLMFAGDALICLFEEKDYGSNPSGSISSRSLDCRGDGGEDGADRPTVEQRTKRRVMDCCYSVLGKIAAERDLTIHGGAAHGIIRCFFLGTPVVEPGNCAFVVSGHPLKQTGDLLNRAGRGEVYIDGVEKPLTEAEGLEYMRDNAGSASRSEEDVLEQNLVRPRDGALVSEADLAMDDVGGFEVNSLAMAYLGTLAARRLDQGAHNAMSILLNELRPVAIVFAGLHDLDDIDPRDTTLLELMNDAFKMLSRITHACNGAVRDMLFDDKGCVFISVFGAHTHEVNPCFDATVSAMRMESALRDLNFERFSLGVSYGECFCGEVGPTIRSDYVVMGPEVNMAARLMGKAPNRSTLVSKRIFTHSKKFVHFLKSEEIQVKGKDGFFHAYIPQHRIDRQSVEISEPSQPFVIMPSRQDAMDRLVEAKQRAMSDRPTIAFVSGGPFLGKSRLINEVASAASEEGFRILKSFRTSLDSFTSFFPLRQIVSAAMIACANLTSRAPIDDEIVAAKYLVDQNIFNKTDKVNMGSIVPTVADAQLLSLLSGMNPKARTKSIVDSLIKILKFLQPLMVILEGDGDMDPSSWSLLAELLYRAGSECPKIMITVSSRDSPTITSAASNLRKNAKQVKLMPFAKNETELYLRVLLGVKDESVSIDGRLLDVVHDRANGCPLFIECVVRWVLEKSMIEYADGSKKMSLKMLDERSDDVTAAIPRELSNILLAPFNKLSPPLWDALKIASCIGYSFDAHLYSTLNQGLDFMPKIEELSEKHGCFEKCGSQFRWKQQAVYEAVKSLLMVNQRQKIHKMIVRAFEQSKINVAAIKGGDLHRLLGRHCALAEDWTGAFEQYMKAGDRAKATFNFNEASKMYEEAIDFQARTKQQSFRSRMVPTIDLGTCLRELARYKEAEAVLTRCLSEAQDDNSDIAMDEELFVRALSALAALFQAQSKYPEARRLYERAVPIARDIQESRSSLWLAANIAGYAETLRKSGDLPNAEKHHREALEIRTHAVREKSCAELELAVSYTQLGCTLAGMRKFKEAYEQHNSALRLRYRYLDFSHGLVSESLNYCAESLCALGRGGEGIPLALHAVQIRKLIFGTSHPAFAHALSVLASCYHAVGRYFDACDCLEKCLEICEVAFQKNHANIIPNLMNYGNVLRSTGDFAKAKSVYERAIAIHQLNFKAGQQGRQLDKCRAEVEDLERKIQQQQSNPSPSSSSPVGLTENYDIEAQGTPVIVYTDVGRDVDDELALVLLSSLKRKRILNPLAIVTTLSPEHERSHLARGSMDAVGMADVPVGVGSSGGVGDGIELDVYGAEYSLPSYCIFESGEKLVHRALKTVPDKSAIILCIASLSDVCSFMKKHEDIFVEKVDQVVIMGGVVSSEAGDLLKPDTAYNNGCDITAARYVYRRCQELGTPTATLSRWAAYGECGSQLDVNCLLIIFVHFVVITYV